MSQPLSPLAIRFFACCAGITALTTLVVHLISFPTTTFDERLALYANPLYMARLWVVMLHIALAIASMWGMALLLWRRSPAAVGLGFIGFLLFAWGEIVRTSLAIFVLNRGWRFEYTYTADASVQAFLREIMTTWGYLNNTLFFLFFTGFTLGTLFYALALLKRKTAESAWDGRLGWVLLIWAVVNLPGAASAASVAWLPSVPEWFSWTYQPFARACIAAWLWNQSLTKGQA